MLQERIDRSGLADIAARVEAGERLSREDGLRLYETPDLNVLGHLATRLRSPASRCH